MNDESLSWKTFFNFSLTTIIVVLQTYNLTVAEHWNKLRMLKTCRELKSTILSNELVVVLEKKLFSEKVYFENRQFCANIELNQ